MKGKAPNCSATGSHVEVVRNRKPNFWIASDEPRASCHPIKKTSKMTTSAIPSVSHSKALSPNRDGGAILAGAALTWIDICAVATITLSGVALRNAFPLLKFDLVDSL